MKLLDIKRQLRSGPHAWPGGYPLLFITTGGDVLCFSCVRKNFRSVVSDYLNRHNSGWRIAAVDANWEDPSLFCDHCSSRIESAYAEDEITNKETTT